MLEMIIVQVRGPRLYAPMSIPRERWYQGSNTELDMRWSVMAESNLKIGLSSLARRLVEPNTASEV